MKDAKCRYLNEKLKEIEAASNELREISTRQNALLTELKEIAKMKLSRSKLMQVIEMGEKKVAELLLVIEISNKKASDLLNLVQHVSNLQLIPRNKLLQTQFHHIIQYDI